MKIILLKFTFCMIVICIAGGCLFYFFKNDYRESQPATPEQLTTIAQQIPCAADAFRQALQSEVYGYRTEVLSVRNARKLAEDCRERDDKTDIKRKIESEQKEFREKQLKALSGITK